MKKQLIKNRHFHKVKAVQYTQSKKKLLPQQEQQILDYVETDQK
jgi:hypothetical protein